MKKEFICVKPKSRMAKDRFLSDMRELHSCVVNKRSDGLAFAATIELQCVDVDKFMENVESIKIVHMTKVQKKEVREALESFVTERCPKT